jgi:energy-coupling factor transporter ATP-binding protein EcfA2
MPIEFRSATLGPLKSFSAIAPAGAIIGVVGETGAGVSELLRAVGNVVGLEGGEIVGPLERRYFTVGDTLNLAPAAVIALDHALATQDQVTRARTFAGLDRLRRGGTTVLLASHEDQLLENLCDEIWWVHGGRLAAKADPKTALTTYRRHVAETVRAWGETIPSRLMPSFRRGDGRAEILSMETLGSDGQPTVVWKSGEMVHVRCALRFHEAVASPVLGLMIRTQIGFEVYGTNTELERVDFPARRAGETVAVTFSFLCDLCPNTYTITMASHDPDGTAHDWLDDAVAVSVTDERYTAGVANLRAKITAE